MAQRLRNKSVLSLLRRLSARRYPQLLRSAGAPAARCAQLSVDIAAAQGAQQQTRRPPLLLLTDGQTDGRQTDTQILLRVLRAQRK